MAVVAHGNWLTCNLTHLTSFISPCWSFFLASLVSLMLLKPGKYIVTSECLTVLCHLTSILSLQIICLAFEQHRFGLHEPPSSAGGPTVMLYVDYGHWHLHLFKDQP